MRNLSLLAACAACGFIGAACALVFMHAREPVRIEAARSCAAPEPAYAFFETHSGRVASEVRSFVDPAAPRNALSAVEPAPETTQQSGPEPRVRDDAAEFPQFHLRAEIQNADLRTKLGESVNLAFEEVPLDDVISRLRTDLKINVLRLRGVPGDSAVSLDYGRISGLLFLDLLVDALDLEWVERDGAVLIGPKGEK